MTVAQEQQTCPVSGCSRLLGRSPSGVQQVICPTHWRRVPNPLRLRIARLASTIREQERPPVGAWQELRTAIRSAIWHAEQPSS